MKKYNETLIKLLDRWFDQNVHFDGKSGIVVSGNTHLSLEQAVEAIASRFAPPVYPVALDAEVLEAVEVRARMLLENLYKTHGST